jgi:hypothetical protein
VRTIYCRKKKEYEKNIIQELQDRHPRNEVRKFYEGTCKIKRDINQELQYIMIRLGT